MALKTVSAVSPAGREAGREAPAQWAPRPLREGERAGAGGDAGMRGHLWGCLVGLLEWVSVEFWGNIYIITHFFYFPFSQVVLKSTLVVNTDTFHNKNTYISIIG